MNRKSSHNNEVPENDAFVNLIYLNWESIAQVCVRMLCVRSPRSYYYE
jgi:hypothetical protein